MFPVLYILLVATLFDIPLSACVGILLSPFYYVVSLFVVIAGYGLWEMRRWSWYIVVISQILVCYENALLVHEYAESHHKILAFLISTFLQFVLVLRVSQEIRVPYLFPRIRWWESNPRFKLSLPVVLIRKNGEKQEGEILDLSMAGCFIKLRSELNLDEKLTLNFSAFGHEVRCDGTVVWCAHSAVTHPKGVGIKLSLLSKEQKRALRIICRRLRKIGALYRSSRYLISQDEFLKKLEELETKERGSIPLKS